MEIVIKSDSSANVSNSYSVSAENIRTEQDVKTLEKIVKSLN